MDSRDLKKQVPTQIGLVKIINDTRTSVFVTYLLVLEVHMMNVYIVDLSNMKMAIQV